MNNDIKQDGTDFSVAPAAAPEPEFAWAESQDSERWQTDLVDVLQYMHDQGAELEVGMIVYRGDCRRPRPDQFVPDSGRMLEYIQENADESEGGEWCDGFVDNVSVEAKQELDTLLEAWARKHLTVHWWLVENTQPYTVTAEDLADVSR